MSLAKTRIDNQKFQFDGMPYTLQPEGLSTAEVLKRLDEDGFNELPVSQTKGLPHFLVELAKEPMTFLLVACGSIYLVLGDLQEAVMLLSFLFIIIGITAYQTRKAERALEALRDLSSPRALVIRDGKKQRIPGREVVKNDLVIIHEGDRIPADGVLISGANISIDESLLTGESTPVDKSPMKIDRDFNNGSSRLYAATTVIRGQGILRVKATGVRTELGKIGKSIQTSRRQPTQLEVQTSSLVQVFAWIASLLCALVIVAYGLTRGNWLNAFLAGLTLAMAILPNELPAVLTIFLALGAWRISQRRVLTRKMSAVENLGAATVLCVDKTGTLTLNRMSIQILFTEGETLELSNHTVSSLPEKFHELIEFGILASQQEPFDPMEKAFFNTGNCYLLGTEHLHSDWALKKEYPLSSELLSISHAWESKQKGEYVIGAKGAPEAIIDLCHLDSVKAKNLYQQVESMTNGGLRVLGIAKSYVHTPELPLKQHDFDFRFLGLVGLADPIRKEVPQAIAECKTAGVKVVMITGDHPSTARSIARQIGLQNADRVITGSELSNMTDAELQKAIKVVSVFSRVVPEQKLKLVEAFKKNGDVVAMTGDGVNDAPALKSAHIGIAMGGRGTDVARESASLVLLDDDFGSIVEAIRMGRRIFENLQNTLVYLLAVHVPIAGMSVLPVLLNLPLVLLPVHIAFLHLLIEPACSVAFEAEPAGKNTMLQPPRNPKEPLFSKKIFIPSLIRGNSILVALLLIYMISLYRGQGEEDARALTFTTLIISNLALIFTSRTSVTTTKTRLNPSKNRAFLWISLSSMAILTLVLSVPSLRDLFRFSTLHLLDLIICFVVGIGSVAWFEGLRKLKHHGTF